MNGALRLVPLLRVLRSDLRNDRWKQFQRVFHEGLCAIAGQTPNHASSVLALPIVTSAGSVTELPALLQLASGYWISQAIYVAAKLGIADVLNGGPASGAQIASATEANEGAILRLMRALCTVGVFRVDDTGKFTVTALGKPLQCGVPGSLRSMIITLGEIHYAAWAHLIHSVRTGRTAFPVTFGAEMFDYLGLNLEARATFNSAMTDCSALSSCAVLLSYDFLDIRSVVDVGGGCGKLLTSILRMYPEMQGTLFDLPSVIADAQEKLGIDPCRDRCRLVSGNFLECVPRGADAYLMSTVIHDWDDDHAARTPRKGEGSTDCLAVSYGELVVSRPGLEPGTR